MKDYTYSVARIRAKEAALLSSRDIEQLIAASDIAEAERLIRDKSGSTEPLGKELEGLADEELISFLKLPTEYHNIKAAVKAVYADADPAGLLIDGGITDKDVLYDAVKSREYGRLRKETARVAEEAMTLLLQTHDGQLCDLFTDKAQLAAEESAAAGLKDGFIMSYAKLKADLTNLKTALRCALTGRSRAFIENALYPGGSLNFAALSAAAEAGAQALREYAAGTEYGEGARYMKDGAAAFEKWCDDRIMELMDKARFESFSAAPVAAYAYAKTTEQKVVNLVLSAKRSGLDNDIIRERVRRLYV